ncbi:MULTISPECIES: hypothetical protein [Actinomyces]|uniref:hypothetical protein n=1 Tax=Actinomyces TaxID=1654 RepID=UPI00135AA59A|nr:MULTISPECIES: hypothetical protein [Actinomyces]
MKYFFNPELRTYTRWRHAHHKGVILIMRQSIEIVNNGVKDPPLHPDRDATARQRALNRHMRGAAAPPN